MSAKIGRPKIENPKTIEVRARLDVETNNRLNDYCKINNLTRSEFIRIAIDEVLPKTKKE